MRATAADSSWRPRHASSRFGRLSEQQRQPNAETLHTAPASSLRLGVRELRWRLAAEYPGLVADMLIEAALAGWLRVLRSDLESLSAGGRRPSVCSVNRRLPRGSWEHLQTPLIGPRLRDRTRHLKNDAKHLRPPLALASGDHETHAIFFTRRPSSGAEVREGVSVPAIRNALIELLRRPTGRLNFVPAEDAPPSLKLSSHRMPFPSACKRRLRKSRG